MKISQPAIISIKMEDHTYFSLHILSPLIVFIITALMIWRKSINTASTYRNLPPGPRKLPIVGNMHQLFVTTPHRRLSDLAKQYGPVMRLQLGEVTTMVISSPETAKQVMKTLDMKFGQRPSTVATDIIYYHDSNIVFAPYGDYWRQLRKICTLKLLSSHRVASFRHVREEELSKLICDVHQSAGEPIDISAMLKSLNYRIISRATFSKIFSGKDAFLPLVDRLAAAIAAINPVDLYPSVKLLNYITGTRRNAEQIYRGMDIILDELIDEHLEKINTGKDNEDILDDLLHIQRNGDLDFPLTTEHIKAVILDMFSGGTETSSNLLEWTMSELIRNPEAMEKAQAEVRRVFGDNGKVDERRLDELIYMKSVIKETLRFHPPIPLLVRECREKCEINGFDIPAKSRLILNVWQIGRDENYWVEPHKFIPERFQENSIDHKGTHFEFIPFGAGRRICPGIMFGMVSVEHTLSQLLYHFDWKLPNQMNPENLDMTEVVTAGLQRKTNLNLIPTPHFPL